MDFIQVVNATTNYRQLIAEPFEESKKFCYRFQASLHQLKIILELEFSSLGSVRKRGFKSGPGLMCMTQTKYLTHRPLCKRIIEKTEESLISSQPRDVG